ncbi:MAG: quinone-dependent dihydroorotate dehydrogenase [Hyphomicrobiaceae bacterium]
MIRRLLDIARPALLAFDPERAHGLAIRALEAGFHPRAPLADDARLRVSAFGLSFPNPIGMAAGFDKDARVPDALLACGFGFTEVGTLTPLPQPGNPRPRLFRLIDDRAVLNRLGFNNGGHTAALSRLQRRAGRGGIVGVNIGANKDSPDRIADYVAGIAAFAGLASYFTVNISSPNTPGLRTLQSPGALDGLLERALAERDRLALGAGKRVPVVVKLSPDIIDEELGEIVAILLERQVDGIAIANTTLSRAGLSAVNAWATGEAGGISGPPVFQRSTRMLARVATMTGGRMPLIGIGGVDSGATALAKIEAGATLVQLYTGLVYEGLGLVERIKQELASALVRKKADSVEALIGSRREEWAAGEPPA